MEYTEQQPKQSLKEMELTKSKVMEHAGLITMLREQLRWRAAASATQPGQL